ncbi:MAG: transglycosylase domain-containing protein, partial [Erysipelotrichaceae bacterium]|nr:transglycosylase domain-containing protein [Erysipelotrichaceae bacterium]
MRKIFLRKSFEETVSVKKEKWSKLKIANTVLYSLLVVGIIGILATGLFINHLLKDTPEFDVAKFANLENSTIYDCNGELIGEVGVTIRKNVEYEDLPTSLVDAFVACEDSRFFSHNGFDFSRFFKAALQNIGTVLGFNDESNLTGGSTITMQLVKNTYFTDDSTGAIADRSGLDGIRRKFQEIKLALELEENLSKEEILELYVNKLNYGANGRGIENAANYYFDKDVNDLTLVESAMLVGTINSPFYYSPFHYLEHATERRNEVLYMMLYHGYITKSEYDLAIATKIEDMLVDPTVVYEGIGNGNPYQAYIDAVVEEAEKMTGLSPYYNTMKIYTAMDSHVQNTMDQIQAGNTRDRYAFPDDLMELASIAIDNDTGEIIGILGGRNYARGGTRLLNHATHQFKQPGSSIKTIMEYPLSFEYLGYSTAHPIWDEQFTYYGTNITVKNYDGSYHGLVTMMQAVAQSLNTPALKVMTSLMYSRNCGPEKIVEYMNLMGYDQITVDNLDVQYAIGGSTLEVSVLQQAAAQAALMNKGVYNEPHIIRYIELDGRYIEREYETHQAISEQAAYLTTILLRNNVTNGNSYSYPKLRNSNHAMYAKSGTSNWGAEGAQYGIPNGTGKDSWINASNADYTVCTWVGYEKAVKDQNTYMDYNKRRMDIPGNT